MEKSLWGDINIESIETPKSILESQAAFLPKLTERKVYAQVQNISEEKLNAVPTVKRDFNYGFYLKSDYLDKYSYNLFSIHHNINIYPLNISIGSDLKEEIEIDITFSGIEKRVDSNNTFIVKDGEKFKYVIGAILKSENVRNIISSLISLSN